MHLARQKVQITFFFRKKIEFRKEHNSCSFCGESHSSCSQKEELFWSYLARQKVQITFFSRKKMTFRKEQKLALFVVRAILHVFERNYFVVLFWCIWQKVQITFFFRMEDKCDVQKGTKKLLFLWWEPFIMFSKGTILFFSDAFGKAKSKNNVLF